MHRQNHWRLLATAFLAGLFVYAYAVTNFALHIDDELLETPGAYWVVLALGRWGTTLLHSFVLPEPFVPVFTPLLTVALYAIAAHTTASLLSLTDKQRFMFAVLYVACPVLAYQLEYPFQSDCIALGVLGATVSYYCFYRACNTAGRRLAWGIAGIGLLVFSISFYQAILFVPSTISIVSCLNRVESQNLLARAVLVEMSSVLGFMAISYGLYSGVTVAVQHGTGVPAASWMHLMVGWGRIPWRAAASGIVAALRDDVCGRGFYGNSIYATTWLAAAIIAAKTFHASRRTLRVALAAALATASIVAPFALVLVLGTGEPPRTFLAQPIALAGLWTIASSGTAKRYSALCPIVAASALLFGSYHVSALFYSDTTALSADTLLGNRIVQAVYRAYPAFEERVTPVYFVGATKPVNFWRKTDSDVFGASFFAWDGGNPDRIIDFFKLAGIADFREATAQQMSAVGPAIGALPAWPNPRSVGFIDGVMVVKLGN